MESMKGRLEVILDQHKAHLRKVFEEEQSDSDLYLQSFGDTSSYNGQLSVENAIGIGLRKFRAEELARLGWIESPLS